MANDYNGYIATYREYQRGDHYRKALTGWGPHSSDYMATRLVYIGRQLRNPRGRACPTDMVTGAAAGAEGVADLALNDARAQALGTAGQAAIDAYEAALPDEAPVGPVEPARGRRALRRGLLHLERRLELHRQPGGHGRARGRAGACGGRSPTSRARSR